jgi:DNA-binding NarL/FixJ family response regulator
MESKVKARHPHRDARRYLVQSDSRGQAGSTGNQRSTSRQETWSDESGLKVLRFATQGLSNKETGEALQVKGRTVEFHVGNIPKKLRVPSRVEAAMWVKEHGIVS